MAEPKKKNIPPSGPNKPPGGSADPSSPLNDLLSREEMDSLSALQILDLISGRLPPRHASLLDLVYLRERIVALEETNYQAQQAIEQLDAIVEKLRSPAFRDRKSTRLNSSH